MSNATRRKQPLVLVSEDYNPDVWQTHDGESETQSWLAVAQDLWGRGCFGPGQLDAMRQGAGGLTLDKKKIVGAAGCSLGGLGQAAGEYGAYIDVFESDGEVLAYCQSNAGKLLKFAAWNPLVPNLKAERYHALIASRAFSLTEDVGFLAAHLSKGLKAGGNLFVDELYAADASVGQLIGQAIAGPGQKFYLHSQDEVLQAFKGTHAEMRSNASANESLMGVIRKGLTYGEELARLLKAIPQPVGRQRLMAFANELQRAAVLYQGLEKGLVTAGRHIFFKSK